MNKKVVNKKYNNTKIVFPIHSNPKTTTKKDVTNRYILKENRIM